MMHKKRQLYRDFVLYMFGFLLLMEWLYPVSEITHTDSIALFVAVSAVFFLITFFKIHLVWSLLFRLAAILGALYLLFPESSTEQMWMFTFLDDLFYNIYLLTAGNLADITDMHRTFLFLILLSILSYLLFYWIVQARRILLFLAISIVYIGIIDTFTDYSGSWAIVRTFIVGLFLFGLLLLLKRGEQKGTHAVLSFRTFGRSFALLGVFIMLAASIGYAMPKPEPQWPDPLPYLQSVFGFVPSGIGTPVQRIGYSEDDRRLGGGFVQDDTPIFIARVESGQYWKGETKNEYTGRGWQLSDSLEVEERSVAPPLQESKRADAVEVETQQAELQLYSEGEQQFGHLFYPGELASPTVTDLVGEQDYPLQMDPVSAMATVANGELVPQRYEFQFYEQTYYVEGLRNIGRPDYSNDEELADYLALPEELPERIGELAEDITKDADNQYDMAVAIEQYLSGPNFEYETENVAIPAEGQDYVDQFLFETARGYCDNFSTAMAVMLRTLDIPTRWAKGFTEGEAQGTVGEDETYQEYVIANSNAHSWVEVYFPEVGWVPFEPTPSFSGFSFQQPEIDIENRDEEDVEPEQREEPEQDEDEVQEPENEEETEASQTLGQTKEGPSWWLGAAIGILAVAALVLFLFRKAIARAYVNGMYKNDGRTESFVRSYERLLWLLGFHGYKRKTTQTLREYAIDVDSELESTGMRELTEAYEQYLYSNKKPDIDGDRFHENWKNILNKIRT